MKQYFVYGLNDPRSDVIFYIGCSVNPNRRIYGHLHEAKTRECRKSEYINNILANGHDPEVVIIDSIRTSHIKIARWLELAYIRLFGFEYRYRVGDDIYEVNLGNLLNERNAAHLPVHRDPKDTIKLLKRCCDYPNETAINQVEEIVDIENALWAAEIMAGLHP